MSCEAGCSNIKLNEGAIGKQGNDGNGWTHGSGVPSGSPSNNKIYYFDTSAGSVYFWNGTSWSLQFTYSGLSGVFGGYSQPFTFNTSTTTGTSAGQIRFNNINPLSATFIYLNDEDKNAVTTIFSDLSATDKIRVFNVLDSTKYVLATVDAAGVTYIGGEYRIPITNIVGSSGTIFSNNDNVAFSPTYLDPNLEDQTHSLKVKSISSIDSLSGTGATISTGTAYVLDADNSSATLFQTNGDCLKINAFFTGTKSSLNSITFRINNSAIAVGVFHDTFLLFEIELVMVSDTQIDVVYKIFQNDMFQLLGRTTHTVSSMNSNDVTFDFINSGAAVTVNNLNIEHLKYKSTTY